MANGTSGTRRSSGTGVISATTVTKLEKEHQKLLDSMKSGHTLWDEGAESGARAILSDLAGKNYSVSGYKLKATATFDPVSIKEVESNLDKEIQGYKNQNHDEWSNGYYSQAVRMLELATGNNYSVTGYKLKKKS